MFGNIKKEDIQRMEKEIKELKYKINKIEYDIKHIDSVLKELTGLNEDIKKIIGVKEARDKELKSIIYQVIKGHEGGIAAGKLVNYVRNDEKARACGGGGTDTIYRMLKQLEMEGKIKRERQGQKVIITTT